MRIGFAGLGRMGWPMAANLAGSNIDLVVWNRSPEKAHSFAQHYGVPYVDTPSQLASRCDIVVTMLADDQASESVHFGDAGLFASLNDLDNTHACIFVEMGTISPDHLASLQQKAHGQRVIDAPVSGATQAASEGTLLIMAGATALEVTALGPVFKPLSRKVMVLTNPGAGCVMKLSVNMLIHGLNQCLAESMALATSAGLNAEEAFEVIEHSAAAAPSLIYRKNLYLDEANHPVSFTVALAKKDIALALELAKNNGVKMPQSEVTHRQLVSAAQSGYAERDMAAMVHFNSVL
ncbi:NAD(P)-dependent oxidoreductase [Reinekea sp.]|jgi:3-hydroxyisobutyrate dehydrogenase|uniref:NAD(P)-dependent oxidoreductase n=1 Tax=Reinekea sp. TaxID=1970455 RepID=UPI002A7EDD53|nr:NAD(P)-dependent oxidoreductase [Reinekea sp.]